MIINAHKDDNKITILNVEYDSKITPLSKVVIFSLLDKIKDQTLTLCESENFYEVINGGENN